MLYLTRYIIKIIYVLSINNRITILLCNWNIIHVILYYVFATLLQLTRNNINDNNILTKTAQDHRINYIDSMKTYSQLI